MILPLVDTGSANKLYDVVVKRNAPIGLHGYQFAYLAASATFMCCYFSWIFELEASLV